MAGKKIRRRPKLSKRLVSVDELTVRRLAAMMEPDETFRAGFRRAVEALETLEREGG